jgi:hypothetical protein
MKRWLLLSLAAAACGRSGSAAPDGAVDADAGGGEASGDRPADLAGDAAREAAADGPGDAAPGGEAGPACGAAAEVRRWATWPVPHPRGSGGTNPSSYDTSTPEVVLDRVTGLEWQRVADTTGFTWAAAKDHCACLSLGGHRDWRLPSRIELISLVDFTTHDPAIDAAAFPGTPVEYFWTSSPVAGNPATAWYIAFFDGNTHDTDVTTEYRARCVRSPAPAPEHRYELRGDGTALDVQTRLTWQVAADAAEHDWAEAKVVCSRLALAGGGWRLPTMKELQTLIDESTTDPAIDVRAFPGAPHESYWTSTPLADPPGYAWFVSFSAGVAYNSMVERGHLVRCVR